MQSLRDGRTFHSRPALLLTSMHTWLSIHDAEVMSALLPACCTLQDGRAWVRTSAAMTGEERGQLISQLLCEVTPNPPITHDMMQCAAADTMLQCPIAFAAPLLCWPEHGETTVK